MTKPKHKQGAAATQSPVRLLLILLAIGLVMTLIIVGKGLLQPKPVNAGDPPQAQLEQALAQKRVVFALVHSTTCIPCKEMEKIAAKVMPEFKDRVVFVDVNVYDQSNLDLLRQLQIRVIPTNIIFDRNGQGRKYEGVLAAEALREELNAALSQ